MQLILDEKARALLNQKLQKFPGQEKGLIFSFRERRNCCGAGYCEWISITLENLEFCRKYEQVSTTESGISVFVDNINELSVYLNQEKLKITTILNGTIEIFSLE